MKNFTIYFLTLLLISLPVNAAVITQNKLENLSVLRTNTFVWGQITGCLVRFGIYASLTKGTGESEIDIFLKNHVGNLDNLSDTLMSIGEKNGALVEGVLNGEQWTELISEVAASEFENGLDWLQTMGCYKAFYDYRLLE